MKKFDLHCHSTCSDGTFSPIELVEHAKEIGLAGLSITDHDTVAAYEIALPRAKELGLELLPGVEFSAVHKKESVHILGYGFDIHNDAIVKLCKRHAIRRINRFKKMLELLAKHDVFITEADVMAQGPIGSIGRPHIALAMVEKGYVSDIREAFNKYLAEGKPGYVRTDFITPKETIDAIHAGGGYAIIAHPHLVRQKWIVNELLEMNFDGLEGYYARFASFQEKRWIDTANKKNWLITGGSDFHGSVKPKLPLGCSWVNEETFQKLHG